MLHELLLTTRQVTKIRNAVANNKSTDKNLSKVQISKVIQSGGSSGSLLGNLGKKVLTNIAIFLTRNNLHRNNLTSNAVNISENKWKRGSESSKRIYYI